MAYAGFEIAYILRISKPAMVSTLQREHDDERRPIDEAMTARECIYPHFDVRAAGEGKTGRRSVSVVAHLGYWEGRVRLLGRGSAARGKISWLSTQGVWRSPLVQHGRTQAGVDPSVVAVQPEG